MCSIRITIVREPPAESIDSLRLDRFELGRQYTVGPVVGALLLAEGWAVPAGADARGRADRSGAAAAQRDRRRDPPNLVRERAPHPVRVLDRAADRAGTARPRRNRRKPPIGKRRKRR
jgi:hypothetical protein